jgi:type I restriction enzyme S subunit
LLDRLEIVEIKFQESINNKDFRLDSNFWTANLLTNKSIKYEKIGTHLINSQYGMSINMNEDKIGYPIYRMNEIHNMLCDTNINKYADVNQSDLNKFKLKHKDVLFNRTNSYEWVGRTGIFYQNVQQDYMYASYLVRFIPNSKIITPEYLTCFLNTKYGIKAIKARARQSINQTNVNPEEVKEIQIPLLNMLLQNIIVSNFESANKKNIDSEIIYKQAEEIILSELELLNYKASNKIISVRTISNSFLKTNRLDAEYYQIKYDDIEEKIKNYRNGYTHLKTYIHSYSTGFAFKSEDYVDDGKIDLIRINNIINGQLNLSNSTKLRKEIAMQSKKDFVNVGDILISMSGTIGISCCITEPVEAVINQRIFKITPQNINSLVLMLYINSILGYYQFERIGTGGLQVNLSSEDIKNILIPKFEENIQQQIAEKIQESFKLRKHAIELLENSKKAVEMAVEQNEEIAIKWLEEQKYE